MTEKVIAVNSQGFFDEDINDFVNYHKPLALMVNEHKQSDVNNLDVLDNYDLAAAYPATTKQRGSAVYVRNGVEYVSRRDLDSFAREGEFECSSVEIPSHNLVLTGAYRSPNSSKTNFNHTLNSFAQYINFESHKDHVIGGDFNIDARKNTDTKRVLKDNDLKFNLRSSTHEKGGSCDNFITDFQPAKTRVMRAQCDKISDHHPIEIHVPKVPKASRGFCQDSNIYVWKY